MLVAKATPEDLILAAADQLQPEIRSLFLQAVAELKTTVPVNQIADMLENGLDIVDLLGDLKVDLQPLKDALAEAASLAAEPAALSTGVSFELVNEMAVRWATDHAGQLITGISTETQQAVQTIITAGQAQGVNVRDQAKLIQEIVGLTKRDALAVNRFTYGMIEDGISSKLVQSRTQG